MDKQKQIEEMAKEVYAKSNYSEVLAQEIARYIVKNDYHKFPEGSVVLTREQYEKDLANERELGELKAKRARKEAVEKFAERLKAKMHKGKALHATVLGKEYVQRIIREVVDEICKEITEGM